MIFLNKAKKAFTLVELLIGILLSSLIFLGAIRFVENVIETDEYQKQMVLIQNETKFAIEYLMNDIQLAGFEVTNNTDVFDKQPFIWANTQEDYLGRDSDSVQIVYENFNNNTDCDGNITNPNIQNFYFVDDQGQLFCNNTILLDNVVSFQLLYGIDIDQDFRVDRFVNATNAAIASNDSNRRVISVKIDLLVRTERGFFEDYEKTFRIMGENEITFEDNFIYRKISRTIMLKNMG